MDVIQSCCIVEGGGCDGELESDENRRVRSDEMERKMEMLCPELRYDEGGEGECEKKRENGIVKADGYGTPHTTLQFDLHLRFQF